MKAWQKYFLRELKRNNGDAGSWNNNNAEETELNDTVRSAARDFNRVYFNLDCLFPPGPSGLRDVVQVLSCIDEINSKKQKSIHVSNDMPLCLDEKSIPKHFRICRDIPDSKISVIDKNMAKEADFDLDPCMHREVMSLVADDAQSLFFFLSGREPDERTDDCITCQKSALRSDRHWFIFMPDSRRVWIYRGRRLLITDRDS